MDRADLPYEFEIVYCGHPIFPCTHTQLKQYNKFILTNFQEEYHPFIIDTLRYKKTQLVCLYIFNRLNKITSITDITDDDQKAYAFAPTYGDG